MQLTRPKTTPRNSATGAPGAASSASCRSSASDQRLRRPRGRHQARALGSQRSPRATGASGYLGSAPGAVGGAARGRKNLKRGAAGGQPRNSTSGAPGAGASGSGWQPGPKSRALFEEEQKFIAPGLQSIALFTGIALDHGAGCLLFDADGRRYIDLAAGVAVASLGYAHPRYVRILQEQVAKVHVGSFTTENRLNFLKLFASVAPGELKRVQFYSSGAEAVEAAIRLAKSYTKHFEIVGFWGGFHGKTGGVLGLLADESFKLEMGPLMPGTHLVPYAYCYRCPFSTTHPKCGLLCAEFARSSIRKSTTGKVAAIIVEPIQGTNGNVIPPPGFLNAVGDIAKEQQAVVISDEMITGFGRTGKLFGFEHEEGFAPHILTIGKGMAGGFPVSGLVSAEEVANAKPFANPSGSSSSYGGNPIASAAAHAALSIVLEEGLIENSRRVGELILGRLRELQEKHSIIGDVRGRGLLIGVELVSNRKSKSPLPKNATRALFEECLKRGLLCMCYSSKIRINPPLNISPPLAEEALALLDEALTSATKRFS